MHFSQWLLNRGLSEKSAQSYSTAIYKTIPKWLEEIALPTTIQDFYAYKYTLENNSKFREKNVQGHNMYSAALKHFESYLHDTEFKEINHDLMLDGFTNEQLKLINIRVTQNKFRKSLLGLWSGCCVSGYSKKELLIASHIKPWSQSEDFERVDPYNGVLLTPNYDALFDKGFISFDVDGAILFSASLDKQDINFFDIPKKIKFKFSSKHEKYLYYHQRYVFQN